MKQDFTLEDILEEQRQMREQGVSPNGAQNIAAQAAPPDSRLPAGAEYVEVEPEEDYGQTEPVQEGYQEQDAQEQHTQEQYQEPEYAPEQNAQEQDTQEQYAQEQDAQEQYALNPPEDPKPKKKKKKRKSLFGWRKKVPDFDENEDDTYYGIQLKPIDEYRIGGDAPPLGEEGYKALFDDSQAIDDEVEENFQRLQQERRRRVAETVQSVGLDEQQIADEFGVVAPMPVTPFAADPYARQHGLDVEGAGNQQGLSELQRAMLETSGDQTMEIKLNVLNSTIELQRVSDALLDQEAQLAAKPVSDEAVDRILASVPKAPAPPMPPAPPKRPAPRPPVREQPIQEYREAAQAPAEPAPMRAAPAEAAPMEPEPIPQEPEYSQPEPEAYEEISTYPQQPGGEPPIQEIYAEEPEPPAQETYYEEPAQELAEPGLEPQYEESRTIELPRPQPAEAKTVEMEPVSAPVQAAERQGNQAQQGRPQREPIKPVQEVPYVESIFDYRSRRIPTHIINADVLQSAILSESETIQKALDAVEARQQPARRRSRPKKPAGDAPEAAEATEQPGERPSQSARAGARTQEAPLPEESGESIEDYTGPEDARSIANELKGVMHKFSMIMMITGICTLLLGIVSLVCRSRFSPRGDAGSWPMAYVVLTLVFLIISAGISYKTVGGGLKALFTAKANADSGAAVAVLAALAQTISAIFFRDKLAEGGIHLYGVVASALLFFNATGKLTMIRRIHSNFRFLTSREQKYAVRTFDDYNTSLKMTKDCVAEKPLIAYQCKTGFLKRFLELSYVPDPSESMSQLLAPLGLLSSLALCIASLLISKDVPVAIGAFAASCCACVAAANMLSVNLPISNMCKTIRRGGGMAVGYGAVERFGDVNAVIASAGELFPAGTVVLSGIKTFGPRSLAEDAIMAASALVKEVGGPLRSVFEQVMDENDGLLPHVERFDYESGGGIVGRVDGRTVYIGNRALLLNHRLQAPAREEEIQYASGNKNVVYIAVDAEVCAMLILTYAADRRRKNELQRLEDSGISVLVHTTDPNVTVALISRLFGVDTTSVGILDGSLGDTANGLISDEPPRADAVAATKGRMESMMSLIAACVEQKRTVGMLVAIQTTAVVLGFVLVAFMACFGAMDRLSPLILFLFELVSVGILAILPKFRR